MLSFTDCLDISDLTIEELDVIARHEGLHPITALEKAQSLLEKEWGPCAVRQMVLDETRAIIQTGSVEEAAEAMAVLHRTITHHRGGVDRRAAPRELV